MTIAYPSGAFAPTSSVWRRHLIVLAVVVAALLIVFRGDVADLATIWWTSTTFGHCLFILPVVAWLVWTRRREVAALTPVGWAPGLALVAVGAGGWLLGEAGGVALARQLGLVLMVQGAVVAILGPQVARGLAFPLAYLLFAVPFGDGLEPPLQDVTVAMTMPLLDMAGIPAKVDGVLIHAGRYWFEVAEACSGAKFVIAMVAFGALVANVCFRSWRRRAVFLAACVVVPVLANGVRAFGTIWVANRTSIEHASGVDHIVYGWVFFAAVMALVMAAAWRWFDRSPDAPAFDPARIAGAPGPRLSPGAAAALALLVALAPPVWSRVAAARAVPLPAAMDLPPVTGWRRVPLDAEAPYVPYYPAADHFLVGRYADAGGDAVDVAVAAFARQREGAELVAFGTGVLREGDRWVRVADQPPLAGGAAVRVITGTKGGTVERVVATWYRVGDMIIADGTRVKLATMRAHLTGGDARAAAVHVAARVRPGRDPRAAIARFVAAAGGPDRVAAAATGR